MDKLTQEQFLKYLREGLNNLRDPNALRRSPLIGIFAIPNRMDIPMELQRLLTAAVQGLEPQQNEEPDSRAWRMYESLYYRYIEQYDQDAVSSQMGMSVRQVRREQKAAMEALCYKLWDEYHLDTQTAPSPDTPPPADTLEKVLSEEVSWLKDEPIEDPAELGSMLPNVLNLFRPMGKEYGVQLELDLDETCPRAAVDSIAMRQVLINLLGIAVPRAARHGQLLITTRQMGVEIQLMIQCPVFSSPPSFFSKVEQFRLDVSKVLLQHFGGRLTVTIEKNEFYAALTLPGLEQLPVMLVDDNDGTHQLFQRFSSGTRYHLVGVHNPAEAQAMVEKHSPQAIILDVMMPRVDGWELLNRLSANPASSQIPVIICTIMAQEELALSLGAKGFLQKPVARQSFLSELDRLVGQRELGLH